MNQATLTRVMSSAERVRLDPEQASDHIDRLFRAAWALCGSREDAEDLVQETYARVLAKPRFLRSEDDLGYLLQDAPQHLPEPEAHREPPTPDRAAAGRARRRRRPARGRPGSGGRDRRGLHGRRLPSRRLSRRARRGRRHGALLQGGGQGPTDSRGDRHEPPLPRPPAGRAAGRRRLGVSRISPGEPGRRAPSGPTRPRCRPRARA